MTFSRRQPRGTCVGMLCALWLALPCTCGCGNGQRPSEPVDVGHFVEGQSTPGPAGEGLIVGDFGGLDGEVSVESATSGDLKFALCYNCSVDGSRCYVTSKFGRFKCSTSSGTCQLSGGECGVTHYRDTVVASRSGPSVPVENTLVKGRALDEEGEPAPNVPVKLFLPNGLVVATTTDQDGSFQFELGGVAATGGESQVADLGTFWFQSDDEEFISVFAYPK